MAISTWDAGKADKKVGAAAQCRYRSPIQLLTIPKLRAAEVAEISTVQYIAIS